MVTMTPAEIAAVSHHTPFGQWIPRDIDERKETGLSRGEGDFSDISRGGESSPERWPFERGYNEYH